MISQQLVTDIHDEGDCLILHEWMDTLKVKTKIFMLFLVSVLLDPTLQLASDWQCGFFSLCNSLRYKIPALEA